jgi:hypothetical protein
MSEVLLKLALKSLAGINENRKAGVWLWIRAGVGITSQRCLVAVRAPPLMLLQTGRLVTSTQTHPTV